MKNKAIFLDRDGVIIEDRGYTYKIEDLKILPGVIEGSIRLQNKYDLVIVTNQSGIGRKYFTKEEYFAFRNEMHKKFREQGVIINAEYFCPHSSEENCSCRKPKTGMLEKAAKDLGLNLWECWMIGNESSDIIAGRNAGCKTIHILNGEQNPLSFADFAARDLVEAAEYILSHNNNK